MKHSPGLIFFNDILIIRIKEASCPRTPSQLFGEGWLLSQGGDEQSFARGKASGVPIPFPLPTSVLWLCGTTGGREGRQRFVLQSTLL